MPIAQLKIGIEMTIDKTLRAIACLIVFFLIALAASTPVTAEDPAKHILGPSDRKSLLGKLDKVQGQISTFQADFLELRKMEELAKPLRFEGKLYYRDEGLFLMHYKSPVRSILRVKNGEALFYVEGSPTADRVDLSGLGGVAEHTGMFVWDPENFKGKIWKCPDGYRFEGSRNNQDSGPGNDFSIFLDRESLLVKTIRIQDKSGDVTEIILSDRMINKPLPSWVADFTLPDGVRVNKLNTP